MQEGERKLKSRIIKREAVVQNLQLQCGILQPGYVEEDQGAADSHLPETVCLVSVSVAPSLSRRRVLLLPELCTNETSVA